jgi:ubiquinone/menaquinone biosynthesis C-methylase UbiE
MVGLRTISFQSYRKRITFFSSCLQNGVVESVLFLGCGPGFEALCFRDTHPNTFVVGIEVERKRLDMEVAKYVSLVVCDGTHLPFKNDIFDWEYCAHVLEHVPNELRPAMVEEIRRTTKNGVLISAPNAQRLIGAINAAGKISLLIILKVNIKEWQHRVKGTFQSYHHRGFTEKELYILLMRSFRKVQCLSTEYDAYVANGTKYMPFTKVLNKIGLLKTLGPSHTFLCIKQETVVNQGYNDVTMLRVKKYSRVILL